METSEYAIYKSRADLIPEIVKVLLITNDLDFSKYSSYILHKKIDVLTEYETKHISEINYVIECNRED